MKELLYRWSIIIPVFMILYAISPMYTGRIRNTIFFWSIASQEGVDVTFTRSLRPERYWTLVIGRWTVAVASCILWQLWRTGQLEKFLS